MPAAADEDLTLAKLVLPSSTTHAAKFAYLAALHSAMAALVFFNGDAPKTHSGVRSIFAKLAKGNEMLGGALSQFEFSLASGCFSHSTRPPLWVHVASPRVSITLSSSIRQR
jgi:uncharacterized protein (UPF0332 family)